MPPVTESSISTRSSELSRERAEALEYYNMLPYGDEKPTGSKVVTSEVFDAVETMVTRLVKVFTSTPSSNPAAVLVTIDTFNLGPPLGEKSGLASRSGPP
jgi:hypothetical protein